MRILRGVEGAALVTALMLTMLALVISMALLYSVTSGTRISASQKRYRSALAAAHGGVELLALEVIPRLMRLDATQDGVKKDFSLISMQLPQYACLQQKLIDPTANWSVSVCGNPEQVSSDPASFPDLTFTLSGEQGEKGFAVSAKIADAVPGNTDQVSEHALDVGMSAAGKDQVVHPQHVPSLYNFSVQGVREGGADREKARLSVLYAY